MKKQKNKLEDIQLFLDEKYPNVGCELIYHKDYELLIAVMLSAQTTDISVNNVTKILFSKCNSLEKLDNAKLEDIEGIIKPIGLYKNKAKNLKELVHALINNFNYCVPFEKEKLVTLSGVGNKTASVVRAEIFKVPEFPVDTHVLRISKRLSLCNKDDDPLKCERKLKKTFELENWIKLHHQFIHFGRTICSAKMPQCNQCKIKEYCNYSKKDFINCF